MFPKFELMVTPEGIHCLEGNNINMLSWLVSLLIKNQRIENHNANEIENPNLDSRNENISNHVVLVIFDRLMRTDKLGKIGSK